MKIHFHTEAPCTFKLKDRRKLRSWLLTVASAKQFEILNLNYIFMSDEQLLEVNRQYLDHDYYTDVITFDNSDQPQEIEGDIFISIDRIHDNASTLDEDFERELHRVMVHGLLHLCGLADKTDEQQKEMRAAEDKMLDLLLEP